MSERTGRLDEREAERVVVTDRRRLDPETGQVRAPAAQPAGPATDGLAGGTVGDGPTDAPVDGEGSADPDTRAAELTGDLQRLSAEYANYRKRVERDRTAVVELATAGVLSQLLPLLDDVDRARVHGDLTGAFKSVGDALEAVTARLGMERYGLPGDAFDPQVHEAVMTAEPDPAATVAVCAAVLQPGFRVSGRVLRPARVSVAEPGALAGTAAGPLDGPASGPADGTAHGTAGGPPGGGQ